MVRQLRSVKAFGCRFSRLAMHVRHGERDTIIIPHRCYSKSFEPSLRLTLPYREESLALFNFKGKNFEIWLQQEGKTGNWLINIASLGPLVITIYRKFKRWLHREEEPRHCSII